jgi:hypothetical protein
VRLAEVSLQSVNDWRKKHQDHVFIQPFRPENRDINKDIFQGRSGHVGYRKALSRYGMTGVLWWLRVLL